MIHPQWATHAMIVPSLPNEEPEDGFDRCMKHAEEHCPQGLTFAVHNVEYGWEWYAPAIAPKG